MIHKRKMTPSGFLAMGAWLWIQQPYTRRRCLNSRASIVDRRQIKSLKFLNIINDDLKENPLSFLFISSFNAPPRWQSTQHLNALRSNSIWTQQNYFWLTLVLVIFSLCFLTSSSIVFIFHTITAPVTYTGFVIFSVKNSDTQSNNSSEVF